MPVCLFNSFDFRSNSWFYEMPFLYNVWQSNILKEDDGLQLYHTLHISKYRDSKRYKWKILYVYFKIISEPFQSKVYEHAFRKDA